MANTLGDKNKTLNVLRLIIGLAAGVMFVRHDATAAQATVPLGSATSFGVLAGSTVTSTGATTVNGDLGISPGTALTGAPTVNGTIHLGDPAAAQAQLDLTTAYNDAAGRTVGAIGVAGNLGGQTLTPGLYKSTSSLEISSGDLTLDALGDANAVFIFQMGSTLTTTSGRQVILSGGAQAANIFWQVGSSATLGTTSVMKGNILALASVTVTTGAVVEGRLLARTGAVTLDSNIVGLGLPADTTPPTVSSTDPGHTATGVALNKKLAATFSEAMDPATISTATFILKQGTTPVAGTVTYAGTTATFAPASALAANTTYTAGITTGAKDLAGNALTFGYGWTFTTGAAPDTTAPTVSATDPADAATAVALNKKIAATFSEEMDPLTISTASFTLNQGSTPVAGTVTYVGTTATFAPASALAANTTYTAVITTGAKDLAGNALVSGYGWTFTTGAALDTTPPTVSSTVPANTAAGVAINQSVNATFSEAMDPATISTANFLLAGPGATPVTGTVAYDVVSRIATFTPAVNLAANTVYGATITTGARDLAGNALAGNFGWSFTTAATAGGQAPVVLGSATTFSVLAASTVTSTGGTTVNGDLGLSPGTAVTGFPPGIVNGTIHAGDPAAALAQVDLTSAYNDAAGRTVGAIGVAGNLGGQTLAPGLYKSTSSLEISSGDLTLDALGDPNAIFIFQMASTLTTTSGRQVILSGGAKAANVFWQVGSSATLGTTSVFKGNILAFASITVTTGAAVEGRLLARSGAVTLDSNTVGLGLIRSATSSPTVSFTVPENAATGAAIEGKIAAAFSEAMDPSTINTTTFTVKQGATPVAGKVTYVGVTATFTPQGNLAPNTTYAATITTGAKDLTGNALAFEFGWSFTTGQSRDTTRPTVSYEDPANGATGVAISRKIAVTFSEPMDPLTITKATYTLSQGSTPVVGTVTYAGLTATFTPQGNLAPNTVYTARIKPGAKDLAGNAITAGANDFVWSFTTGAAPDTTPPIVSFTVPANAATGVAVSQKIAATFSEAMDPLTTTTVTFTLKQGAAPVVGTVTYAGVTATFNPLSVLAPSTTYTATITTETRDLAGNALASAFVWSFTTGATPDTTAPIVSFTVPANAATGVAVSQKIAATFSEAMDPLTTTTLTFTLKQGTTPVVGTVIYAGVTATFNPLSALAPSTTYTASITTGSKDLAGNALANAFVWSFTTGATPDTTAPIVSFTVPANAATGVAISQKIAATFSEPMDPLTTTPLTFILKQGATPVVGTVTYAGVTATFNPLSALAPNTTYTATIATGTKDLAGNPLASAFVWIFTTGATPDTTAPIVSFTVPANAATGVAISQKIAATFSEAMDPLTTTPLTFTLKQGTTPVVGTVTYAGVTATFNPLSTLAPSTTYTATITTGTRDLAGNALASAFVWSFTTGATPDTTAPTVSLTVPANAATGVAISQKIAATFSEAMDPLTTTTVTFTLKQGTTPVVGTVTYAGVTATFNPLSTLAPSTTYTATITTGTRDLAGNALASSFVWSFTTGVTPDTTAPTVSVTVPVNAASGVPINQNISAAFSEAMDPLTTTTVTFTLKQGATPVVGTVTYAGVTTTFNPLNALAPLTAYTATITTGVKDLAGNPLVTGFSWSFTTGAALDTTPPTISSTVPANAATGVAINQSVNATFSQAMDPLTISTANFLLAGPGATPVIGTVTYDVVSKIATFTPAVNLAANTVYGATISTGVKDLAGNALAANFGWSFTTAASAAGQAPVVLGSATTFSVLAASTVTSTGATTVNGDLGWSPGTAVTGFPPGILNGTLHAGDPAAALAQVDLTSAYNDAAGRTLGAIGVAGDLGGQTLGPGLYKSTSSLAISSGDLTLDAKGDANAIFIFQMASTLTTTSGRQVILSNGAKAANVFWQVGSSATLGTTSVMKGNILAFASITVTTGAAVEGRLLARSGAVTLDSNTITIPSSVLSVVSQSSARLQSSAVLQSAALPAGPYTDAAGQSVNLESKTITVPMSGAMQFYRIRAGTALTITGITISGSNVVITHD